MPILKSVSKVEQGSSTSADDAKAFNTVFVDTSVDTHLVLIISDTETVSDLRRKIHCEHLVSFPNIGDIKIHSVKVKRRKTFYHLSDSMFVKSVFEGVGSGWFVFVDVSKVGKYIENGHPHNLDSPRRLTNTDDVSMTLLERNHGVKSNLNADQLVSDSLLGKRNAGDHDRVSIASDNSSSFALHDKSRNEVSDVPNDSSLYSNSKAESFLKRKCKRRKKTGDALVGHADKRNKDSVHASSGEGALQLVTMTPESYLGDGDKSGEEALCRLVQREEVGDKSKNADIIQVASVTAIETIPVLPEVGVERKDLTEEPDTCFALVQVSKGGMRSEPCPTSPVVKNFDPIQETDLKDNEMEDIDADQEKNFSPSIDQNALADIVERIVEGESGLRILVDTMLASKEVHITNAEGNSDLQVSIVSNTEERNRSEFGQTPKAGKEKDLSISNEHKASDGAAEGVVSANGRVDTGKSVKRKTKSKKQLEHIDRDSESKNETRTVGVDTSINPKELHITNKESNSEIQVSILNNNDERNRSGSDQSPKAVKEKDMSLGKEHIASDVVVERAVSADGRDTKKSARRKQKSRKQLDHIDRDSESKNESPTLGTVHAPEELHITNEEGNSDIQVSFLNSNDERKKSGSDQSPRAVKEKDISLGNEHKASDVERVVSADGRDTEKSVKRKMKSKKKLDYIHSDSESKNETPTLRTVNTENIERVEIAEGNVDTVKSVKKARKSKKQLEPVVEHFTDLATLTKAINGDHLKDNVEKELAGGSSVITENIEKVEIAEGNVDTVKSVKKAKKSKKQLEPVVEHFRDLATLAKANNGDHLKDNLEKDVVGGRSVNTENIERVEIAEGNVDKVKSVKKAKKSEKQLEPVVEHFTDLATLAKAINGDHLKDNLEEEVVGGRSVNIENIERVEIAEGDTVKSVKKAKKSKKQLEPVVEHFTDLATLAKAINGDHLKDNLEKEVVGGRSVNTENIERVETAEGNVDTVKSVKKAKKSKKQLEPVVEHFTDLGTLAKTINGDHLKDNVEKEVAGGRSVNTENIERVEIAEGNVLTVKSVKKAKKSKKQLEPVVEHFTDLATLAKAINGDHLKDNVEKEVAGGRSVKKTKKSKKQLEPGTEHLRDLATPAIDINGDHLKDDLEEEEADGRSVKRVTGLKKQLETVTEHSRDFGSLAKAVNDDHLMEDVGKEETDTAFQNVQQTDADQENSDGTDKKLKNKSKKRKSGDTISISELQTMDSYASHIDPALSDTIGKEDDDSFKFVMLPNSLDTPTVLNETNSGLKSNIMVGSVDTQVSLKVVSALDAHQGNNEDETPQVTEKSDPSLICTANEPNSCMKVHSNTERSQPEYEIDAVGEMRVDNVTDKIESNEKKGKGKRKKHDSQSDGPLHKPYENQNGAQVQVDAAAYLGTTKQLKTLPEDKSSNVLPDSIMEDPESGIVGKKTTHPRKDERSPRKKAFETEEIKEKIVASKSDFESSKGQPKHSNASRKVSGKKGALVNKLESKKSLLAISGSIFNVDYKENSEDEDALHKSDTSTRTPSDVSTDYSDEDSDANCSTPINGSYSSHGKESDERNTTALSSGSNNMSLHKILTSSSRYKKAKLIASQSQPEDDDIELVPDSQPV